jgi:ATP-binding cassette subfamily F protein 3
MITLQNVSFDFAARYLYRDIDWHIGEGERIGLIGKNGTGKSTLLRIITGEYQPTEGTISRERDLKIGFLNQDLLSFSSDEPLFNVVQLAFGRQLQLEREIEELLQKMETDYTEDLVEQLTDRQAEFEHLGGYEMEARTHEILDGLGFKPEDRHKPYDTFSGGWRMRAMLAQILLRNPDLLLLDEPTNHLDLPSIEWLESYIRHFRGSYIIVSHDREFLDRMVEETIEVANQTLYFYDGNYTRYLQQREERILLMKNAYENQQKQIAVTERNIARFKAKASKASQAQSWMKMLDRMERLPPPEEDTKGLNLRFKVARQPGLDIVQLRKINKSYGDKQILVQTDAVVRRGDKIGLVGPNGVGKSTLLRIIAGTEPFEGERIEGYNVEPCFFAQHQLEALNVQNSIWEEVLDFAPDLPNQVLRTTLGCFLFSGDTVDKKIKVLSGGEKSRVAMAKVCLTQANFMLFDEPTNHLDIQSIDLLIEALREYTGTFVVVSHDRHFLRQVTNKVWYVEDRQLKEYPGTFAEWEQWMAGRKHLPTPVAASQAPAATATHRGGAKPASNAQDLQRLVREAEARMEACEKQKAALELELAAATVANDAPRIAQLTTQLQHTKAELATTTEAWETHYLALESLRVA